MVRLRSDRPRGSLRSPHVRGDGPLALGTGTVPTAFSPRAWGWSANIATSIVSQGVLPTCVGMVRKSPRTRRPPSSSPHVRGDGPFTLNVLSVTLWFSPRAWGWSGHARHARGPGSVLPTCVGMVRGVHRQRRRRGGSPHVRGDGPFSRTRPGVSILFSPRAWGWSAQKPPRYLPPRVLPTCVGMVWLWVVVVVALTGSPHVRGDGPPCRPCCRCSRPFSPRAWGWSACSITHPLPGGVLPTCVGMVRSRARPSCPPPRSPHVRGDGPGRTLAGVAAARFSPRAWGWSGRSVPDGAAAGVLPTCVGMVRRPGTNGPKPSCSPHVRGDGPHRPGDRVVTVMFSPRAWGWVRG